MERQLHTAFANPKTRGNADPDTSNGNLHLIPPLHTHSIKLYIFPLLSLQVLRAQERERDLSLRNSANKISEQVEQLKKHIQTHTYML